MQKGAAMAMDSPIGLTAIKSEGIDTSNLESFYIPFRESEDDSLYLPVRGDFLMGITKNTENYELAKEFVEFYFSDAWYPDYISKLASASTMETVDKELDPVFESAERNSSNVVVYTYNGGDAEFQKLVTETRFDYKKLGAQMFEPDFNIEDVFTKLNKDWKKARQE